MLTLPLARTADLVVQSLDNELLVYDLRANVAISLNDGARRVFAACDGRTRVAALQRQYPDLSEAAIELAVRDLGRLGLLEHSLPPGRSRRELLKAAALTAAAIPVVTSLVVPDTAAAQSCLPGGAACNVLNPAACCSGTCDNTGGSPVCTAACLPGGATCSVVNPGACCSGICQNNGGNPICEAVCTPNGGPCTLVNPAACCSLTCSANGGNPICTP